MKQQVLVRRNTSRNAAIQILSSSGEEDRIKQLLPLYCWPMSVEALLFQLISNMVMVQLCLERLAPMSARGCGMPL
jgi:hypothetical protein